MTLPEEIAHIGKKPNKILYKNQEEIHGRIVTFVNSILTNSVFEAYITGSAARREFGKYVTKYKDHDGSDIDVVVMMPHGSIPRGWKDLKTKRSWWDLYSGGFIEVEGTKHRIDLLVVQEGKEDQARKRLKELGWVLERIK